MDIKPVSNIYWLIERNSMWGCEWFCAVDGEKRWTKEAHKAILFPSKDSAIEGFSGFRREDLEFPFTEYNASSEWEYHYSVTEHMFIGGESALSQAREEGRREGMREARRIASTFSLKKISIHPDIEIDDMNETARAVYHSTCQCVALEIDAAITRAAEGK